MKNFVALLFGLLVSLPLFSQSAYISCYHDTDREEFENMGDLGGAGGIKIFSKANDLIITVTNVKKPQITPKGIQDDGFYRYDVVVDINETTVPKVEVNRRGDINKTDFVARIKPDSYCVYVVEEVVNPIRIEDQTKSNDAILDANLAAVEISSTLEDLQIAYSDKLNAKLIKSRHDSDNSIYITTIEIPVAVLNEAKDRVTALTEEHTTLYNRLVNEAEGGKNSGSDADWKRIDELEEQISEAEKELQELVTMEIYGSDTNRLSIDLSSLGPRSKMCYGVLLLVKTKTEYVTQCSAMLAEGARYFATRNYEAAKKSYDNAMKSKDAPLDMIPTIKSNIAECDSCILYERYAAGALLKMNEMRKAGEAKQSEVVRYAGGASEFLQVLNNYNNCEFYTERIAKLEKIIEDMPLVIKFTAAEWIKDFSGFYERGRLANIELWAYYGDDTPAPKEYKNDRKTKKLLDGSSQYVCIGTTDANGEVEVNLVRKSLPKAILFRPVGYNDKIKVSYYKFKDIMSKSEGTYDKRQYRLRMYKNED